MTLAPGESRTVVYSPADHPRLRLPSPRVWWPAGMGGQPLYDLDLAVSVDGVTSDTSHTTFGIRDVQAPVNADGARQYRINGRPLLIKGAGWSPDEFLRWDAAYAEHRMRYVRDLGLNTLRLEGHLEPDEFFDLADRYGILTIAGWECCNKWEGEVNPAGSGEKWTAADHAVARASMAAEAARLRDHPAVISFLIGSDAAPNAQIESGYLEALRGADWDLPVIPSAAGRPAPVTGASGMRMTGPYDWVPPGYWYDKREGGATGFNSETSAGPSIPTMDTLRRMLTPAELETLWKRPDAPQYHRSPLGHVLDARAVQRRARRPLRPPGRSRRLRAQGPAGPVRDRPGAVRGVHPQRQGHHRPPRPASSTGCSTAAGPRCTGSSSTAISTRTVPTSARRRPTNRSTSSTATTTAR
ncbi:hypothetical protein GCM10020295_03360 [Streptomyces cinereospinus]